MDRPVIRHVNCPKGSSDDQHPRMAEDFTESQVFLDGQDIVIRILYVCPNCGMCVRIDGR